MAFHFDTINDVLSTALESGQSREFTGEIDCYDGHELSGEAVADATIEAKVAGGSFVAIETTPIDLSTWAGTRQALVIKMTAGTITAPLTRSFRLRAGQPFSDTTDPTAPVLSSATADSDTEITMVWAASTDDVGVTGYETRIDGGSWTDRGNVLTYQYTGLTPSTEYDFEVRAYDAAGNHSAASNLVSETTDATPLATSFSDDFNDNSIDGAKWSTYNYDGPGIVFGSGGTTITETGGQLVLAPLDAGGSNGKAIVTVPSINFTGLTLEFDVVQYGGISDTSHQGVNIRDASDTDNYVQLDFSSDTVTMQESPGFSQDYIFDIDPLITKWRIVHTLTDEWEFWSYDGSWTLRFTTDPTSWSPTEVKVEFFAFPAFFGATHQSFIIDNVDVS